MKDRWLQNMYQYSSRENRPFAHWHWKSPKQQKKMWSSVSDEDVRQEIKKRTYLTITSIWTLRNNQMSNTRCVELHTYKCPPDKWKISLQGKDRVCSSRSLTPLAHNTRWCRGDLSDAKSTECDLKWHEVNVRSKVSGTKPTPGDLGRG